MEAGGCSVLLQAPFGFLLLSWFQWCFLYLISLLLPISVYCCRDLFLVFWQSAIYDNEIFHFPPSNFINSVLPAKCVAPVLKLNTTDTFALALVLLTSHFYKCFQKDYWCNVDLYFFFFLWVEQSATVCVWNISTFHARCPRSDFWSLSLTTESNIFFLLQTEVWPCFSTNKVQIDSSSIGSPLHMLCCIDFFRMTVECLYWSRVSGKM